MLFKTAMRQRLLTLAACIMLGSMSSRASETDVAIVAWDETTATLYFDHYDSSYEGLPAVGSTWTTSQNETITVSQIWSDVEVLNHSGTPGWVTEDIQNACTKVVIGNMGEDTPKSCNKWFYHFSNLTSIEGLWNLNTGQVKDMDYMFSGCSQLTSLDLIGFDTENVLSMQYMFSDCSSLTKLYLSTFNTSSVFAHYEGMFSGCTKLKTIYVDENLWVKRNENIANNMFEGCTSLVGGNRTAYDSANTGLSYAHVDKPGDPGYLTAGTVFAGRDKYRQELTFGFGDVPKLETWTDDGYFYQVWYGKEALNRSWADDVGERCTKVQFAGSFYDNVKGLNMNNWFEGFSNLQTVENFVYVTPGNTDHMFYNCGKLTSINMSSTLKQIGDDMFGNCTSLSRLFIPKGVTSIGSSAFYQCISVAVFEVSNDNTRFCAEDGVLFTADKTELVAYPNAKADEKYAVPNGVKTIRSFAFFKNKYLTSVILPNSLSRLGDLAFGDCAALTSVKVNMTTPPSIQSIVFDGTANHATLYVPSPSYDAYKAESGWKDFSNFSTFIPYYTIWAADAKTLYFDSGDDGVEVPVVGRTWKTKMGRKVNVTNVWVWSSDDVDNSKKAPGWSEVKNECEKVVFYYNIEPKSCYGWFANFKKLKGIENILFLKTQNVTDMSYMFSGCSELTFRIEDLMSFNTMKVTDMSAMFSGCTKLTELHLGTFDTRKVRSMDNMFSNCTNLKAIYVDENLWNTQQVTTGDKMFAGCTSLVGGNGTAYDIANTGLGYACVDKSDEPGYLTAGTRFVVWCSDNATLTFDFGTAPTEGNRYGEGTVTQVWKGSAFYGWIDAVRFTCTRVVFTSAYAEHIKGLDMDNWFLSFEKLTQVQGFENLEVGRTYGMFSGCESLTSITLPATMAVISKDMFYGCSSLSSINIPEGVTTIGESAFAWCLSLASINIPKGVTTIENGTFDNCRSLISIVLPAGITSVGGGAFYGCTSLSAFKVNKNNTHFTAVNGVLFTADKKTLLAYPAGKKNTEYTIPDGTQFIGKYAFNNCENLTSVILPGSIRRVYDNAFVANWLLASVKIYATRPPSIGDNDFSHYYSDIVLYVPRGCKEVYEASNWNHCFNNIEELYTPGDANDDGEVDAQDIVAITNYIAGVANGSFYEDAADINGDGEINIADIVAIAKLILSE